MSFFAVCNVLMNLLEENGVHFYETAEVEK